MSGPKCTYRADWNGFTLIKLSRINLLLILWLLCFYSYAQKPVVIKHIRLPQAVEPAKYFTLFADAAILPGKKVNVQLQLPEKWQVLLQKQIQEDSITFRLMYTVTCPSNTQAGSYPLALMLGKDKLIGFTIDVKKVRNILITPLNLPEFLKEGDNAHLEFMVQNAGNIAEKFVNKTNVILQNDSISLAPGQSIILSYDERIAETTEISRIYSVVFYLLLADTTHVRQYSFPVYGKGNKQMDEWLRFPIEVSGIYSGANNAQVQANVWQYSIRGKGFLDFDNAHYLDFTLHGPNQFQLPIIGSYEVYHANYRYKQNLNLQLGDYNLRVSNLIELGKFSRGLHVTQQIGPVKASAYFAQPRFFTDVNQIFGANALLSLKSPLQVGIGYAYKKFNRLVANEAHLVHLWGQYRDQKWQITTELAGSLDNQKSMDFGFENNLSLQKDRLFVNSDIIYAGKNFHGFYHNSWLSSLSANYQLSDRINVGFSHNITRINPSLDLLTFNTSPFIHTVSVFSHFRLNLQNMVRLSYNYQEREDRADPKSFFYRENYANVAYDYYTDRFVLLINGRWGTATNLLLTNDNNTDKYSIGSSLNPQVRLYPGIWLGGILEHQLNAKYTSAITNFYFYGGTLRVQVKNNIQASFMYRNNYTPDALVELQSNINGSLQINHKRHGFTFSFGKSYVPKSINIQGFNRDAVYFSIKYSLKMAIPLAKNKRTGAVHGQVISQDASIPLSDIILQLGDYRVFTDKQGAFYFNNLQPGEYMLQMINSTLPAGVKSDLIRPIRVEVKKDSIHQVQIYLFKTGNITGQIYNFNAKQKELPILYVTAESEKGKISTQTNAQGFFEFKELLPTTWQISAKVANGQAYTIVNGNQEIVVESEVVKKLSIEIKPVERKLNYSQKTFQIHVDGK